MVYTFTSLEKGPNLRRQVGLWRFTALCCIVLTICMAIGMIVMAHRNHSDGIASIPTCGKPTGGDEDAVIDLREPERPGPFHDLTRKEIQALRVFLEKDSNIRAVRAEDAMINNSAIFMMDLYLPKKSEVLKYLDENGPQPLRQARIMMFRGDQRPPRTEEYICGPLPDVSDCSLLKSQNRRNPVEFSVRPLNDMEMKVLYETVLPRIDKKIGHILRESFGTSFDNCKPDECFKFYPSPMGTNTISDVNKRLLWLWALYPLDYYGVHPSGFGVLLDLSSQDVNQMKAIKAWYNNQIYDDVDEFVTLYDNNRIEKVKRSFPKYSDDLFSTLHPRGTLFPEKPKRPPTLVEPDGKRYTLKNRKVEYLGWSFNFKLSALTGPSIFDVRYRNERIAYEVGLAEIAVYYSANNPMHRSTDYADSGTLIGSHAKALVPGGDCPETATFINMTFPAQEKSDSVELDRAFCLFENNNGYPLRRHVSYSTFEGGFYGGLLDSVLILRTALTVVNYDYIVDFVFHQNGVVETVTMSTGYIFPSWYRTTEEAYGFHIEENILGNVHHHMFHFKADLDVGGTSNRYETLDLKTEDVKLRVEPKNTYYQTKYEHHLRKSEKEALYKFNFDEPKYHVVYNDAKRTKFGEIKAYRLGLHGMSKQVLPEDKSNERTISWARHQLVVTKHKDDEQLSSSPYAMWDSANPVTDFTKFYDDDESIVDEDLVFWISEGMHHIPHTEDLPVTPTVGNHLTFFLFPYNYFDECPSVSSRDQIYIGYKDLKDPSKGLKVNRSGNIDKQCVTPQVATAYDKLLEDDPDVVIESRKFRGIM